MCQGKEGQISEEKAHARRNDGGDPVRFNTRKPRTGPKADQSVRGERGGVERRERGERGNALLVLPTPFRSYAPTLSRSYAPTLRRALAIALRSCSRRNGF